MTFYDYKTGPVTDKILFDTTKTGMSFYNDILHNPEYMEKHNNLKGEIVMMTPTEYFQGCADIFGSTYDRQVSYTKSDTSTIDHLVKVIKDKKVKFPIGFLNFAEGSQEGRHRMFVAGMLSGWQTEQPVLVINWADEERHNREEQL
ncbi:MAG: hypothetical protein IKW15_02725, partial [Bacteroidales bacterium]|nr:hypothetical protein [Bacteroidales bacterium]